MNMDIDWIIDDSIFRAEEKDSALTPQVIGSVGGFCGEKFRHLLNRLGYNCKCYLEIGSLHGASLTSVCYGNKIEAYAIENFSEFDGKRETLTANAQKFAPQAKLIFGDCWAEETKAQVPDGKVDLFYYDGPHSEEAHERVLREYAPKMAEEFIYLVDDWNWPHVKAAAERGIANCKFTQTGRGSVGSGKEGDGGGWWNGVGIFSLSKL